MFTLSTAWIQEFPRTNKSTGELPFHLSLGYELRPRNLSSYYTECGKQIPSKDIRKHHRDTGEIPELACLTCKQWYLDHYKEYQDELADHATREARETEGKKSRSESSKEFFRERIKRRQQESLLKDRDRKA